VVRGPADGPTFEAFTLLSAIAVETHRIRLGPGVARAAFRNPALLVKMAMTLDVASNGRVDLAMGAGWHEGEWRGYGYGYPSAGERLALLREALEVVSRMLEPGPATWHGERFHVDSVISEPKGAGVSRIPIIVGGNGQKVTWRLAARFADELNLDGPELSEIREWLPIIRQRCEEIDRDPATLALSAEIWWKGSAGEERVDRLEQIADLGLARITLTFAMPSILMSHWSLSPRTVEQPGSRSRPAPESAIGMYFKNELLMMLEKPRFAHTVTPPSQR